MQKICKYVYNRHISQYRAYANIIIFIIQTTMNKRTGHNLPVI